jgi:crossover junction endodeoxyribonuclease RuvC
MIILGIDPGTASTGYGIIKNFKSSKLKNKAHFKCLDYGVIKTSPSLAKPDRLKKINNELDKIMRKYRPEVLAVESLYFFKNLKTAIPVSQAGGVILLTAAKKKIPVYEFTPLQVKLMVAGFGRAEKEDVQKKTRLLLKLKDLPKPDDAADALAIALAFSLKRKAS